MNKPSDALMHYLDELDEAPPPRKRLSWLAALWCRITGKGRNG